MGNSLSIRAYSRQHQSHAHPFYQLVLPVQGSIQIELEDYSGSVGVGDGIIIPAGMQHLFAADEHARFVVADLDTLPESLLQARFISLNPPLASFLSFVQSQLEYQVDPTLEDTTLELFWQLLSRHQFNAIHDPRIQAVQSYIRDRLATALSINELAEVACLSPTQFKLRFKRQLGESVYTYLTRQRLEKAKALLTHTDLPVQRIAEQVGYQDPSAFSRRFHRWYGLSPRAFRR